AAQSAHITKTESTKFFIATLLLFEINERSRIMRPSVLRDQTPELQAQVAGHLFSAANDVCCLRVDFAGLLYRSTRQPIASYAAEPRRCPKTEARESWD